MITKNLTALGTLEFTVERPSKIMVLIGPTGGAAFGSNGRVAVAQDGIVFTGLGTVTAPARATLDVRAGAPVVFTLTSTDMTPETPPDLDITVWVMERYNP